MIKPQRFPFFYGYLIALVGTIGIWASIPGQTAGVSTFTDPVKDALSLTRDQFSLAYMIGTLLSSIVLTRAGKLYDRYGVRPTAALAVLVLAITLLLCSYSPGISGLLESLIGIRHWAIPFVVMVGLFFMLRFSGQGVLTMTSRNMIMKWFDQMRGRINAFSSVSVSLGFSASPLLIDLLIQHFSWQGAWQVMALGLVFVLGMILLFYKDNPESYGLHPDGSDSEISTASQSAGRDAFTLEEAKKTRSFWMYALILAFHAFFVTGLTFHVVSLFAEAGLTRTEAISIFLPMTVVSVLTSLIANFMSDWMRLKVFLYVMIAGALIASFGLLLIKNELGVYLLIIGLGVTGGLFAVINAITWPRYYGRQHLGAISGKAMSMIVMASAIGPYLFSVANTLTATYGSVGYVSLAFLLFMLIGSLKANRPMKGNTD
ncbi:MFS transporter [Carboxylicivirga sediminis]|uniref:MFS transporter n=1 Tax=Carboxylicivirga sediminis TaxID=2006564 RepID=A0A941IW76_9BACT|nr:MFS transporter [Carboxylicivirga sediminis]MBR8534975.1 MFS transporter [Carboxylicivirga sediminis]